MGVTNLSCEFNKLAWHWHPALAGSLTEGLLCKLTGWGTGKAQGMQKHRPSSCLTSERGRPWRPSAREGPGTEEQFPQAEVGKAWRMLSSGDSAVYLLWTRSITCWHHLSTKNLLNPGTNLKNRGWCSTWFSSKTRRLSLCSCSILCFCISASSKFPSSRNLRHWGKKKRKGYEFKKTKQSLLRNLYVSTTGYSKSVPIRKTLPPTL